MESKLGWDKFKFSAAAAATATADADAKVASCHGQNAAMACDSGLHPPAQILSGVHRPGAPSLQRVGGAQNFSPHNRLPQLRAGEGGRAGINALNPISAFPDRSTSQRHLIPHLMPHRLQLEASWWLCWSDSGHCSLGYRYIGGLSRLILFLRSVFHLFVLNILTWSILEACYSEGSLTWSFEGRAGCPLSSLNLC